MILRYVSPSRWWRVLFLIQTKLPSNRALFERAGFRFRGNEQTLLHHNLAARENGQPAQPVEQIKQTTVVGSDVVALDARRAFRNVGQEMADLTRPARI